MARERMVTRTVQEKVANVLTVNTLTRETNVAGYCVSATIPDDKICKKLKKLYSLNPNYDNIEFVTVISVEITETLYGMPETDFIRLAKVLPPRNTTES